MELSVKFSHQIANCSWNSACRSSQRIVTLLKLLPVRTGLKSLRKPKTSFWLAKRKCGTTSQRKLKLTFTTWSMQPKMNGHCWGQWFKWAVSRRKCMQSKRLSLESTFKTMTVWCHSMRSLASPKNQESSRILEQLLNQIRMRNLIYRLPYKI